MKPVIDFNLVWEDENIVFIKWMAFQDTMIFIFFFHGENINRCGNIYPLIPFFP